MSGSTVRQDELDGIRAVAVIAVVLFHCKVPGFGDGFIGVDLFFVLSGFLITRLLLREHALNGRISLVAFWSRRVRRIVPSLLVTVVATLVLTRVLASAWEWEPTLASARAAVASISNLHFLNEPGGYFDVSVAHRPLLHTWSLGVEEQFYLVWPISLAIALRVGGRRAAAWWLAVVTVGSLIVSTALSYRSPDAAFYLPHSRVWELAIGGATAFVAPLLGDPRTARMRVVLGWGALAGCAWTLTGGTEWRMPSPGAVLPVLATAALITSVDTTPNGSVGRLLSIRPLTIIGRWSYSWYLFHWPAITFVQMALGRHDMGLELIASVGALALAGVNWTFLEQRFARGRSKDPRSARRMLVGGVAASLVVLAGTTILLLDTAPRPTALDGIDLVSSATLTESTAATATTDVEEFDWKSSEGRRILAASRENVVWPCIDFSFNSVLDPRCIVAPGDRYILVVGDSHASSAAMAVAPIVRAAHVGLVVVGQPQCPVVGVEIWLDTNRYGGCREWALRTIDEIATHPDQFAGVIWTARSDSYFPSQSIARSLNLGEPTIGTGTAMAPDSDTAVAMWRDAIATMAKRLGDAGIPLVLLHSSPELDSWPSDCVSASGPTACAAPRDRLDAYRNDALAAETAATAGQPLIATIDPYVYLCDALSCPVVDGREVLYRDDNHLSPQGSALLTQPILEALRSLGVIDLDLTH